MIKQKLKLYYKFLVQKLFQCLYGKILITNKSKKLIKRFKVNNSTFKTFNNKSYYLYNIKKARIYTDNNLNVAVIKDNILIMI